MKKLIIMAVCLLTGLTASAQKKQRISIATTIGTGIALLTPKSTPLTWQVVGYYELGKRISVGVGTGLSFYEKTLIPVFADVKFLLIKPRKFTPYLECGGGYGFAPGREANGGLFVNPSIGVQCTLRGTMKLFFVAGYELQQLEQLKNYGHPLFSAEFAEKLHHNSISLKIGFLF